MITADIYGILHTYTIILHQYIPWGRERLNEITAVRQYRMLFLLGTATV